MNGKGDRRISVCDTQCDLVDKKNEFEWLHRMRRRALNLPHLDCDIISKDCTSAC